MSEAPSSRRGRSRRRAGAPGRAPHPPGGGRVGLRRAGPLGRLPDERPAAPWARASRSCRTAASRTTLCASWTSISLATGAAPVVAYTPFHEPTSLFYGMAWLPPGSALASGAGDGMAVHAFDVVFTTKGTLARAPSRDVSVGMGDDGSPYYVGTIGAVAATGRTLLVAPSDHATDLRVFSLAAATYGPKIATIPVGTKAIFDLRLDPDDPAGTLFYASDQADGPGGRLIEIDAGCEGMGDAHRPAREEPRADRLPRPDLPRRHRGGHRLHRRGRPGRRHGHGGPARLRRGRPARLLAERASPTMPRREAASTPPSPGSTRSGSSRSRRARRARRR